MTYKIQSPDVDTSKTHPNQPTNLPISLSPAAYAYVLHRSYPIPSHHTTSHSYHRWDVGWEQWFSSPHRPVSSRWRTGTGTGTGSVSRPVPPLQRTKTLSRPPDPQNQEQSIIAAKVSREPEQRRPVSGAPSHHITSLPCRRHVAYNTSTLQHITLHHITQPLAAAR